FIIFMPVVEPIYFAADPTIYTLYGGTVLWRGGHTSKYVWMGIIVATTLCLLLDLAVYSFRLQFFPNVTDVLMEIDPGLRVEEEKQQDMLPVGEASELASEASA